MTKQKILESCEKLFFETSFKEVSMQKIADVIGIKKASIYYHFPSKNDIIIETLNYSFEKYIKFITNLEERWVDGYKFEILLKDFLEYPEKNKNLFSIINRNGYQENDEINSLIGEKQKAIFDTVHKAMNRKGSFSKEKTYLFLLLINQIGLKKSSYNECDIDDEKILTQLEALFFN